MSNKGTENERHSITCKEMCVVERRAEGSLGIAFHPIPYDYQVLGRLSELSEKVKDWEANRSKQLANELGEMFSDGHHEPIPDVSTIASRYRELVWSVYQLMGIEANQIALYPGNVHNEWQYQPGIHNLPEYSVAIREFDVSPEVVESYRDHLDEPSFQELQASYRLATNLRVRLLPALDEYERGFNAYISHAEQIQPGIFERKSFCLDLTATYGDAELDFAISPGNQCVVERVNNYYWALVLEQQYKAYDRADNIIAYSHRKLGWGGSSQTIPLERRCDLHLLLESNFGYGSVSYLRSTLSYKGVCAINASLLIFFQGAGKVGFSDYTFNYEVSEENFKKSFDDVVRVHADYRAMGEARFVDKYFRKSLADLADLMLVVAKTDTFLQITTLERLNSLTSGPKNTLIPNEGFSNLNFHLSTADQKAADELVATVLPIAKAYGPEACVNSERIGRLVDRILNPYKRDSLQLLVKRDLIRNCIIHGLLGSFDSSFDVGALAKAIIPQEDDAFVETYEGYELISMRVEKATTVIGLIARLRQIASTTKCESSVDSIASTCRTISEQAKHFIQENIDPELERVAIEQSRVKQQLDRAAAEVAALKQRGIDTSWIEGHIKPLKVQFLDLANEAAAFREKKKGLQIYIQNASSV